MKLYQFISFITVCHLRIAAQTSHGYVFTEYSILEVIKTSCFVAFSTEERGLSSVFADAELAFNKEDKVVIGLVDFSQTFTRHTEHLFRVKHSNENVTASIIVFPRRKVDRSCLSVGKLKPPAARGTPYSGHRYGGADVIEFINEMCGSYRQRNGYLNVQGLHREEILRSLFHVENVSGVSMRNVKRYCSKQMCLGDSPEYHSHSYLYQDKSNSIHHHETSMHQCDKIALPSKGEFFHKYLKLSKPVIIKNAMNNWPAVTKWTNDYFRKNYGDKQIHIKLTPAGIFEGVDRASEFKNFESFKIPSEVYKQLLYPDLVVVRPATQNMNLSDFIDLIERVSEGKTSGLSAYLEYSSLSDIVEELEGDVSEMPFFDKMLKREHLNIWLSDGKTLGKLHFDPFDNFLCQISGKKEVILFSPHDNTRLYEAHIPEANLAYDTDSNTFIKKTLITSTSMVMSPVDLENPNYERFPKFAEVHPMNCTIEEGEVLFMPAFWWHEVQSYPSPTQKRNLAVNFWYDPFLIKEFPCQDCKLDVNPNYRHLL